MIYEAMSFRSDHSTSNITLFMTLKLTHDW